MSDHSVIKAFEQQQGTMKLSQAIRVFGYTDPLSYKTCVLGRAYTGLTGRALADDGHRDPHPRLPYTAHAAHTFGVPFPIAAEAELMCIQGKPPEEIAAYVESEGY